MKRKEKTSASSLQPISKKQKMSNAQSGNQQVMLSKLYSICLTGQYKCSLKRCIKRGCDERLLAKVIDILTGGGQLPLKFLKHPLGGMYKGCWECHVSCDLLLVWRQDEEERVITLIALCTHSELFDKQRR